MKITANIMMKDEERCIYRCIKSIYNIVDEIIIVDTGSKDKSMSVVKDNFGDKIKIFEKEWNNDFSEIRNYMISQSSNPIIFQIDADEYVQKFTNVKEIMELLDDGNNVVSVDLVDYNGDISRPLKRIFANTGDFYYCGKVHEELRSNRGKAIGKKSNISLNHDGYKTEILKEKDKANRNITLLEEMLKDEPDNPRWLYFMIRDLFIFYGDPGEIVELIKRFEDLTNGEVSNYSGHVKLIKSISLLDNSDIKGTDKIIGQLKAEHPDNVDYIYVELLKINNEMEKLKKRTFGCIEKLMEVECFDSFLNSNGDHIRAELFKKLLSFSEYDKAFLIFRDMNENVRDEIFGRELRSLASMVRNSDKDFNKVGQYQCLDLVRGIL